MRLPIARGGRGPFGALLCALALALTSCAERAPQDYLRPASEFARKADALWDLTFWIATVIFFLVEGALLFTLFRFRHRPGREASQFHGNTRVEILLTAVPALILAGIAVPTVRTIFDLAEKPPGAMKVNVVAHRFWWEFEYVDQDLITANELHVPTGQTVRIALRGDQTDPVDPNLNEIIHSFWVPRLTSGKQDVIPGRRGALLLEADEPGTYLGQCTEYCGLSHANMRLRVVAQTPADFQAWVADQKATSEPPSSGLAAEGARLFAEGGDGITQPCSSCHAVASAARDAQPKVGPNLANFATRQTFAGATFDNNAANLSAWIAAPAAVKPGAMMPDVGASQDQIDALVAYLQTLK